MTGFIELIEPGKAWPAKTLSIEKDTYRELENYVEQLNAKLNSRANKKELFYTLTTVTR